MILSSAYALLCLTGLATAQQTDAQRKECLGAHNTLRASVLVPRKPTALAYNTTLEEAACTWAEFLADNGKFQHSGGKVGKYGENLWKITYSRPVAGSSTSCRPAVASWASEKKYYQPGYRVGVDGDFTKYGHWSQALWSTTRHVGCCGKKSKDGRSIIWACEYHPPGNSRGQKAY